MAKMCRIGSCGAIVFCNGMCRPHNRGAEYERNRERDRATAAAWYVANREKVKQRNADYHAEHAAKINDRKRAYRADNTDRCNAAVKAWANRNKARTKAYDAARYAANADAMRARGRAYSAANREKERARSLAWQKSNPSKVMANCARWRASKLNATPSWANQFFIEEIYDLARLRTKHLGVKHHVDHIVPLQHPLVCGLHVEHNLRVIPAFDNISKNNRHWPDMPT